MRRVAIVLSVLIVVFTASASFLALSRTSAVQNPTLSLDMDRTGNTYCDSLSLLPDGTTPCSPANSMTVGTIDNCLTEMPGDNNPHNVLAHLIVQNVEDLAGAQVRINHDDSKAEVTNVLWAPFTDSSTLAPVGFINLPIDPVTTDHRALTGASDFSTANTSLASQSYLGDQILANVVINVKAGQVGQPSLVIDLDDNVPNPPGSSVDILTGAGIVKMNLQGSQLGDGFIGEGVTCVAGAAETPTPAPTPTAGAATPTPTPTRTAGGGGGGGSGGGGGTATPTGARTATPRVSPAALPPTGTTPDGDSSLWVYALLLGGGITALASGTVGLYRLRKR